MTAPPDAAPAAAPPADGPTAGAVAPAVAETPAAAGAPTVIAEAPRSLGRLAVAALGVNCVVGSGVFLLPGPVAARLVPAGSAAGASPPPLLVVTAVVGAGVLACLIALCFAEVASRYRATGGAYLYAREAFGPLAGFAVGWLSVLAGIVAWGALVEGFAVALGRLVPAVAAGAGHAATILAFLGALAWLNLRGARSGGALSTAVSGVKLATLIGFAAAGALALAHGVAQGAEPLAALSTAEVTEHLPVLPAAILLMLYAYVGFENLVVPAGEMERPERSLPRSILGVLATVTVLYAAVLAVVAGALPDLAGRQNAVAVAAGALFGTAGGTLVAVAVVISITGVNAASALILPRRLSALADGGDLPAGLGRLHPRHGTPWAAIAVTYALAGAVALSGSFAELAALAVVGRLMQYLPTCLAVLVLRRRERRGKAAPPPAALRLPGGPAIPLLALTLAAALLLQATPFQLAAGAAALAAGLPLYWWQRAHNEAGTRQP